MQIVINDMTDRLSPASAGALNAAKGGPRTRDQHDICVRLVPALSQLEYQAPSNLAPVSDQLRVAAWNAERCMFVPDSRALLDQMAADVVLLTEVDLGMTRSANLHTVRELARPTGEGYVYGVEFVETGRGSLREALLHPELENAASFHGNAILSRLALTDCFLVRLDDGGVWYQGPSGDRELRIGYRNAIVARIADVSPRIWVASVHLESSSDADDRARQVRRLIACVSERAGDDAVILGGDFNTNTLRDGSGDVAALMLDVEASEPLFAVMRDAGYSWAAINTSGTTQRTRPDGDPKPPFARLDWLFCKGLVGENPATFAAVGASGVISDHDAVLAEFMVPDQR